MKKPDEQFPTPPAHMQQPPSYTPEEEMRLQKEVEELRRKVARFFTVYDVRVGYDAIAFYCRINEETLAENFELLRNMLKPDYIPMLNYEGGEHVFYVMKKPRVRYKRKRVNLILLIATIITTTIAGSSHWVGYYAASEGQYIQDMELVTRSFSPSNLVFGALFFALPLLAILGTHELAHYLAAKRHGVAASLPFFMPMPPFIMPLGTLGAVISMREPIPNKKALIDIGSAGPIAGLIVAIPVVVIGFYLTSVFHVEPVSPGGMVLNYPLLLIGLGSILPMEPGLLAHPTFFAGWVGILITALNLLPAGQLDGGHISRALLGDKTRYIGMATVLIMIFLGFLLNFYGYVLLIVIIMVLGGGLSHPPPLNDITKLDKRRVMVGVLALIIFIVSFHPAPIQISEIPKYGFELSTELNETEVSLGGYVEFNLTVRNIGDIENEALLNATLNQTKVDEGWNVTLTWVEREETKIYNVTDIEPISLSLDANANMNVTVRVYSPSTAFPGENITVTIKLEWISWEFNVNGELRDFERRTHKEIKVRVE